MVQSQAALHRCSHCTREFARSEHLVRHERTHTKEKPFECPQCGQVFSRQDLLKRHEKKGHDQRSHGRGKNLRSASWQSKFPAQPVHQLPLPPVPDQNSSPQGNGTLFNSIFTPNTQLIEQVIMNGEQSPQLPPSSGLWTGVPSQWSGSISDNNPLIQDGPFPYDLNWLDTLPASFNGADLNLSLASVPLVQREEQGTSVLSRPGSPSPPEETRSTSAMPMHARVFSISEDHRQRMQSEVNKYSAYILPPRMALSQFIQRYFKTFHLHMPFIQESTWMPEEAAVPLVLAICANGAIYSLERDVARSLHQAAVAMVKPIDTGLWVLQTFMLLIAFAVWSGKIEDLRTGLQVRGGLTLLLRHEWSEVAQRSSHAAIGWMEWRALESIKRTTFCLFTLFNLMQVAYDIPSPLLLEDQYGMPFHEVQWRARTEAEWQLETAKLQPQEWLTAQEIIRRLGDQALPTPSNIGIFGCHVIISTLLQKIILFRQSCSSNDYGFLELRQKYIRALRRWQMMWESEPDSSLSPDHPCGPILFNSTAILRVAYIRLVADFSQIRRAFSFCDAPADIEAKINLMEIPLRDPQTTRAALQACLALRIPVHLGFKVVSKTSFWMWSVQHSLCYFECALLLSKWVKLMENSSDLSEEEQNVLALVSRVLNASGSEDPHAMSQNLPAAILRSWARLLDTGDMTVWQIQPKMAQVLRLHAAR